MIKKQAIARIVLVSVSSVAILMITLTAVRKPIDPTNSSAEENELLVQQNKVESIKKPIVSLLHADQKSPDSKPPILQRASDSSLNEGRSLSAPGFTALKLTSAENISKLKPNFRGALAFLDNKIHRDPSSQGRDRFEEITSNPVKKVSKEPVSTFSVDVDTASYGFIRKSLNQERLPQKNAVRIEEMIHYFNYQYPSPKNSDPPFKPTVVVYPNPWNPNTKLLHIGIKGYDLVPNEKPRANLVFLIDVSGSMSRPDKLPLLKKGLRLMVENLDPQDRISIVTYAGSAGTVLEPTKVEEKSKILLALQQLIPQGSTAGAQGIQQAYNLAKLHFDQDGVNHVILATDGDFNIGITNPEELKGFVERQRHSGIFLLVLGLGQGNYNDALMQALAQNGNGNAAYIDTLNEARKVLVDESSSTLFPIAKDVKIQAEFNPHTVTEYRLIDYENRILKREDFKNDQVDAGDIGSGHTVTAIYEITPIFSKGALMEELRNQKKEAPPHPSISGEYMFLKIRNQHPQGNTSKEIKTPIDASLEKNLLSQISSEVRFATSVAAFGQLLRGGIYLGDFSYDQIIDLGEQARGDDPYGYRSEFLNLVRLAKSATKM